MAHGVSLIPRVYRSLDVNGLVQRENIFHILESSSIDGFILTRKVFTFMGLSINGSPWPGTMVE